MKTLTGKAMLIILSGLMVVVGTPLNQTTKANEPSYASVSSDTSTYGDQPILLNPTSANVLDLPRENTAGAKLAQQEWTYNVTVTITAPATGWGKVEIFTNQKSDLLLMYLGYLPTSLPIETSLEMERLVIRDQWGNDVTWTSTLLFWGIPYREFHLNETSEPPYFISYRVNLNRFIEEIGEYRAYCSDTYALFAAANAILLPKNEVQNMQYVENPFQVYLDFQLPAGWEAWVPAPKSGSGFRIGISDLWFASIALGSSDKVHVFSQVIDGTNYSMVLPQRDLSETPTRLSSFFTFVAEQNRCLGPLLSPYYTYFLDPPGSLIATFPGASINSMWTDIGLNWEGGYHEIGHAWAAYVVCAISGGAHSGADGWGTESFNIFYQWRSAMWPRASTFAEKQWIFQASQPPYDYNLIVFQEFMLRNYDGWLEFLVKEGIPLAPMENPSLTWRDASSLFTLFFSAIDASTKHQGDLNSLFLFLRYALPKSSNGVADYTVGDLQEVIETLTASNWASFFTSYIYGTLLYPKELICRDSDQDSLWDTSERQAGTNPSLADSDGDGLTDFQELVNLTDPLNLDTDFDGVADKQESDSSIGLDPRNPDTDGGGESDGSEMAAGRNPMDPSDDIGDNVAPSTQVFFPLSGFIMDGNSFVAVGTAWDNKGIERVEWRMDSGNWHLATGTNTWWVEIGPLSPGIHRLETRAKDAAGNYSVLGLKRAGVLTSTSTFQVLPFPYDYRASTLTFTSSYRNLTAGVPVRLESQIKNAQDIPLMGYTITTIITSPAVLVLSGVTDQNGIVRWDYVPPVSGKLEATAYFRTLTATLAEVAPDAVTDSASQIQSTSANLKGTVNPRGQTTAAWFEWGSSTAYGQSTPHQPVGDEETPIPVLQNIGGLEPETTYHFRVAAQNITGTSYGSDQSFTTTPSGLIPYQFNLSQNWNMISFPLTPASLDPQVVFGGLPAPWYLFEWDPLTMMYVGKESISLDLGVGYWLKVPSAVDYPVSGVPNGEAQTEINLGSNWNLIGVPYEGTIPWGAVRVSRDGGALVTLDQVVSSNWIQGMFFHWNGSMYDVLTSGGNFQSTFGYWLKAKVTGMQLVFLQP